MFVSTGGGSGKGNIYPNRQVTSGQAAPTAQQYNAVPVQQVQPPVLLQHTFHSAYVPHQPNTIYQPGPHMRVTQSPMPPNFSTYPYFIASPFITTQHPPNILPTGVHQNAATNTFQIPHIIPTNIQQQPTPCQPGTFLPTQNINKVVEKKRTRAVAIINPVTRRNILEDFCPNSANHGTTTINKENPGGDSKLEVSNKISNTNSENIKNIQSKTTHPTEIIKSDIKEEPNDKSKETIPSNVTLPTKVEKVENVSTKIDETDKAVKDIALDIQPEDADNIAKSSNSGINKRNNLEAGGNLTNNSNITTSENKTYERIIEATNVHDNTPSEKQTTNATEQNKASIVVTPPKPPEQDTRETSPIAAGGNPHSTPERGKKGKRKKGQNVTDATNSNEKHYKTGGKSQNPNTAEGRKQTKKNQITEKKNEADKTKKEDNAGKVTASRSTAPSPVISKKANLSPQRGKDHKILDIETKNPKFTTLDNLDSNLDKKNMDKKNKNINTTADDDIENNNDKKNVSKLSERDKDVAASNIEAGAKRTYDFSELINLSNVPLSKIQPKINHMTNCILLPSPRPPQTRHMNFYKTYKISGANPTACGSDSQSFNISGKTLFKSNSSGRLSFKPNKPDIIHVRLSLRENVQLNETENAWKPAHLKMENSTLDEIKIELFRKVRGILNKLTPEKFDVLVEEIMKLQIDTCEKINGVMMLVFEKAIDEPNFSESYARLCQRLAEKNLQCEADSENQEMRSNPSNMVLFKTALLDKTEREFHDNVIDLQAKEIKLKPNTERLKKCTDPKIRSEIESHLEEQEYKLRQRSCGTVRFIGELFKISMLTGNIIKTCVISLLDAKSEEKLECLCKLLRTVGKKLEQTPINNKEPTCLHSLEDVINKMQAIVDKKIEGGKISNRVRFMLQDIIDLRRNFWTVSNREPQGKISDLSQQDEIVNTPRSKMPMKKPDMQFDNRRNRNDNFFTRNDPGRSDEVWFKQTSKGTRIVDTNKLGQISNTEKTIKLGDSSQFMWKVATRSSQKSTNIESPINTQKFESKKTPRHLEKSPERKNIPKTALFVHKSNSQSDLTNKSGLQSPKKVKSATVVNKKSLLEEPTEPFPPPSPSDQELVNSILKKLIIAAEESISLCIEIWSQLDQQLHWLLAYNIFNEFLHLYKTKLETRILLSDIIFHLIKQGYLNKLDIKKGYSEFCKVASEIIIDIPKVWQYIFEFIGPLIHKNIFQINFFWNNQLRDSMMGKKFLKSMFTYFTENHGINYTKDLWKNSKFKWQDFLKDNEIQDFIEENQLQLINLNTPTYSNDSDQKETIYHIEELLKKGADVDGVIDYLYKNKSTCEKSFIYQFTKTLCKHSLQKINENYTLKKEIFQKTCVPLLQRYIDSNEEFELECLKAIQGFVEDLKYPTELLFTIFWELLDSDVIPRETFLKWWSTCEKTTNTNDLKRFFNLLTSESSDEIC